MLGLLSRGHLTADHLLLISVSPGPKEKPEMNNFLKYPLEFTRINAAAKNIVVAQSLDDPWTYPEYANVLVKDTKGTGMLYADRGHFESEALPDDILSVIDRWTSFS